MEENNYIVYMETNQISIFKLLVDSLKDILRDVNMKILPINDDNENDGGVLIVSVDKDNAILIKIKLFAKGFCKFIYNSKQEQYILGINMQNFSKLLKNIEENDKLFLYVNKNDENYLYVKIENEKKNITAISKLKLLDIDDNLTYNEKNLNFPITITLNGNKFHKIIKDLSNIGDKIIFSFFLFSEENIKEKLYSLILETKGDFGEKKTIMSNHDNHNIDKKINEINLLMIQNTYENKNFLIFGKCHQISDNIEINIKKDDPLILKYKIGTLGHVYLFISPVGNINNNSSDILKI